MANYARNGRKTSNTTRSTKDSTTRGKRRSYRNVLERENRMPINERRKKMYYKVLRNLEGKAVQRENPRDFEWKAFNEGFDADYENMSMRQLEQELSTYHGLTSNEQVRTEYIKQNKRFYNNDEDYEEGYDVEDSYENEDED